MYKKDLLQYHPLDQLEAWKEMVMDEMNRRRNEEAPIKKRRT